MRILEVLPHADREASGPTYSVTRLADALGLAGHDVCLVTLQRGELAVSGAYRHIESPPSPGPTRLGFSSSMLRSITQELRSADLIHSHGLWMMPNIYPAWASARTEKPLIVSPRGTLSAVALARSRYLKWVLWRLWQKSAVRQAACLHATSDQEYRDIRRRGLGQPVAIIPNGVHVPTRPRRAPRRGRRRLLYLGRIHPIKGLEILLQSWSAIGEQFPDWELRLVGPGAEGYRLKLQQMAHQLGLKNVTFEGARYGDDKSREYDDCDLYVLPSFSENFAMSVAEALAHGVPVVATTGTPWSDLPNRQAGWWVDPTVHSLTAALQDGLAMSNQTLRDMGENGRRWMEQSFSWDRIARDMESVYGWLVHGGEAPDSVRLD